MTVYEATRLWYQRIAGTVTILDASGLSKGGWPKKRQASFNLNLTPWATLPQLLEGRQAKEGVDAAILDLAALALKI